MDDLLLEIDQRCQLIANLIGSCCVWKRTEFCMTEQRLKYSFMHHHPFCNAVKKKCGLEACIKNDTDLIFWHLRRNGCKPFLHKCYAGACELVIPIRRTGRILGCLLCGPFAGEKTAETSLPPWRESLKNSLPELADLLLSDLLERYYNFYPDFKKYDKRIEEALNYMASNCFKHITLQEAASAVYLSPSRFSHLFKSCCGIDFSSYLRNLRLIIVKDMLKQTSLDIGEIALLSGFSSQQHLTSMFKKQFGLTPNSYRKAGIGNMGNVPLQNNAEKN